MASEAGKGSTRRPTDQEKYEENFVNIFRKKKPEELWTDEDEKRMDQIGQNGPTGEHYNDEV